MFNSKTMSCFLLVLSSRYTHDKPNQHCTFIFTAIIHCSLSFQRILKQYYVQPFLAKVSTNNGISRRLSIQIPTTVRVYCKFVPISYEAWQAVKRDAQYKSVRESEYHVNDW